EKKWLVACKQARSCINMRGGLSADLVKRAGLRLGVVDGAGSPELLVLLEIVEIDVPRGLDIMGLLIKIDLIGLEQHGVAFDLGLALQVTRLACELLL